MKLYEYFEYITLNSVPEMISKKTRKFYKIRRKVNPKIQLENYDHRRGRFKLRAIGTYNQDYKYYTQIEFSDLRGIDDVQNLDLEEFNDLIGSSNIDVYCSCPAFTFQGHSRAATDRNANILPQDLPRATIWADRHDSHMGVCKHILQVINVFRNPAKRPDILRLIQK